MTVHPLAVAAAAVSPWKNGGGTTRELLSWPPGSAAFDWRVSIATISADGPFSTFAGVDRTLTLVAGGGIRLRGSGIDRRIADLDTPFEFDGAAELDCELLAGTCTALNVMGRRGRGRARIEVVAGPSTTDGSDHGLLLALTGEWEAGSSRLAAGAGLWWAGQSQRWRLRRLTSSARLAVVGWRSA